MPVEQQADRIILTHPKGSTATVLLYGATVISWKTGSVERLFVSAKAALDGSKAVRGGIPVVFPCFGQPTIPEHGKLSQHGFARSSTWTFDSVVLDTDVGVSVRLVLNPTPEIQAVYPIPFTLAYVITLSMHQLSTDLHVTNTSSSEPLRFQALLHNYFRVTNANDVLVAPLQGKSYYDKTAPTEQERTTAKVEGREKVDVRKYTDSVYEDAGKEFTLWPYGDPKATPRSAHITIKTTNLKDLVIWNPNTEGTKIVDMEDKGWERYVCVEPGTVRGFESLAAGQRWIGQQVLTVIHE